MQLKKTFWLLVSALSLLISFTCFAEPSNKLEAYLKSHFSEDGPGISYLLSKNSKQVFSGAYGLANVESQQPLSTKTIFKIASLTKQITSAAIMKLHEQGKLNIHDDIRKYLPDFPSNDQKITIEHLMAHTARLARNPRVKRERGATHIAIKELITLIAQSDLVSKPGEKMAYSNSGYALLGRIIEVVSGLTYQQYIEREIFSKLGMNSTQYGLPKTHKLRAEGYFQSWSGSISLERTKLDTSWSYASGGVAATVLDFSRWQQALRGGKFISEKSYLQMIKPFKLNDGSFSRYGYGLNNIKLLDHDAIIHQGGTPGYRTGAVYLPEQDVFVAVFSNIGNAQIIDFLTLLSAQALGIDYPLFKAKTLYEQAKQKFSGGYKTPDGDVRSLYFEDGIMYSKLEGALVHAVEPMENDVFLYKNSLSYFILTQDSGGNQIMKYYPKLGALPQIAVKL